MHNHHREAADDRQLTVAVFVNVLLTVAQILGGIFSGSLALIADAVHNLGDAATLAIAVFARKIGRRPANQFKTFGYKRAELIAALINQTALVMTGIYLIYEALWHLYHPEPVQGWIVIILATIALLVDILTALLTWRQSHDSLNIKTAFIHNLTDALASVGVIIAGSLILLYQWYWVDALLTLLIAAFILHQGYKLLPETVHILMEGTPEHLSISNIIKSTEQIEQVESLHHVHVWQLDEHRNALEAHVVVHRNNLEDLEKIKQRIRHHLHDLYDIEHSTLEIELHQSDNAICQAQVGNAGKNGQTMGHC